MAPVDAVRPPKKATKPKKASEPNKEPVFKTKSTKRSEQSQRDEQQPTEIKEVKMWAIVGIIMLVIFITWILLLQGGKLFGAEGDTGLRILGNKVAELWETIQDDVLKIEDALKEKPEPVNAEVERIQELEEALFPEPPTTNNQ